MEFKPGDVVRLKSGGPPKMTVQGDSDAGDVLCQWFENGKVEIGTFAPASLEKIEMEG
jgi:uncharacterized protein YodC (DUF2158 family)